MITLSMLAFVLVATTGPMLVPLLMSPFFSYVSY